MITREQITDIEKVLGTEPALGPPSPPEIVEERNSLAGPHVPPRACSRKAVNVLTHRSQPDDRRRTIFA